MSKTVTVAKLLATALLAVPLYAHAVGLGSLTVLSALGQPLNAEVQIVALRPGEEESLKAKLASPAAFTSAGIQLNPALLHVKFAIEHRAGHLVLHLSTVQPINDPFLDALIELQWASGRLVREYTFLLDPPNYGKAPQPIAATPLPQPAPAHAAPAHAAPPQAAPAQSEAPAAMPAQTETTAPAATKISAAEVAAAKAAVAKAVAAEAAGAKPAETYKVKKGDTLAKIAREHLSAGVSLNEMLVALYRANKDAFIHDNLNLVRAGAILDIPSKTTAAEIEPYEARHVVMAHMRAFGEYRRKLAAAVAAKQARRESSERSATGRITAQPSEAAPPEKKAHLTLAKTESKHPGSAMSKAAKGDDRVALQQALAESQSRVADLQKNVADLKKLLELKNEQLADLEKKSAAAAAAAAAGPAGAHTEAPASPTGAPPGAHAAAPAAAPTGGHAATPAAAAAAAGANPGQPSASAPASTPKPAPAPKPVASTPKPPAPKPAPKPEPKPVEHKPMPKPVAPPPDSSLVDEFLGNPLALGGLGIVVVLLVGYGAWAWRRKKAAQAEFHETLATASGLGGPSALGTEQPAAGGVAPGVSQLSVNPSGLGSTETEEVDPIAEADVYMAYGRDAQAEEILKEALQKDPNRAAIHAKLLEIYANRRDIRSFEQAAVKLKDLTHGSGPDWDKVAKLGRSIDPQNPAYAGAAESDTVRLGSGAPPAPAAPAVDFDLGGSTSAGEVHAEASHASAGRHEEAGAPTIDFDLGTTTAPIAAGEKTDFAPGGTLIMGSGESKAAAGAIDFDLGAQEDQGKPADQAAPAAAAPGATQRPAPAEGGSGPVDFDFNLDLGGAEKTGPAHAEAPGVDLAAINLDLGSSGGTTSQAANADPKWQEVATKLDLAKAYEEMGDKDGARDLLNEALKEGDTAQQGQARQMLASLG